MDLAFGQTHGGATRVRDKSNPDRFGNGHSAEAKRISLECKKLRRVVRFVHKQQLNKASQLCLTLAADGIALPDVYIDEPAVIQRATAVLKRKRLELQGRNRAQLILNSGGVSGKSQESKQRAATKRGANTAMERCARGAIASVTIGVGDAAEVLTDPLEVARGCCEWSDRRMSLMQPKWFRRLDVAVGYAVWVAEGVTVKGGFVRAIDNDGHYTVSSDAGASLCGVRRENLCLKWQVGLTQVLRLRLCRSVPTWTTTAGAAPTGLLSARTRTPAQPLCPRSRRSGDWLRRTAPELMARCFCFAKARLAAGAVHAQ